jgi:alginate O-acetyltransferase complex protein AlgI
MAMAICGLWHGPSWHFVIWGIYHGLGLSFAALLHRAFTSTPSIDTAPVVIRSHFISDVVRSLFGTMGWVCTMVFVGLGWLLFFYPVEKAMPMAMQLFTR